MTGSSFKSLFRSIWNIFDFCFKSNRLTFFLQDSISMITTVIIACHPHQYTTHVTHVSTPPSPPKLAHHPRQLVNHATHASTLPTQTRHLHHPRWHVTHNSTRTMVKSTPFLKLLYANIYHFAKQSFRNILNICLCLYHFGAIEINQLKTSEQLYWFYTMNS